MKLKLKKENAINAYKAGNLETKSFLESLYTREVFMVDIKDRLTGYESACAILGRKILILSDFEPLFGKHAKKQFAGHRIATGIEAINDGWVPDFDDEDQYKYYNWIYSKKRGFGSVVDFCYVRSVLGSLYYIESREKAERIMEIFKQDYIDYYL